MTLQGFSLSIEELAMGVALLGYPEDAGNILKAEFGELTPEQARAYLDAASHSLLARDWVELRDGKPRLRAGLAHLLQHFVHTKFSIHIQKRFSQGSTVLAYHFREQEIVSHLLTHDVVHYLAPITAGDVLASGVAFLEVPESLWEGEGKAVGQVKSEVFRQTFKAKTHDALKKALQGWTLNDEEAQGQLLEDFLRSAYRATLLLIEYDDARRPFSRTGAFVLKGESGRVWFFIAAADADQFTVRPFTLQSFRELIQSFLEKGRQQQMAQEQA